MKLEHVILLCLITPLSAQERYFTRALTVSGEVELSSPLGPIRAETRRTAVLFHTGVRESTGVLFTMFEPQSGLVFWSYGDGAVLPNEAGAKTDYRHPGVKMFLDKQSLSIISVYLGAVQVLVSALRAKGPEEALELAVLGLDGYVEAVRSRNFDARPGVGWPKPSERPMTIRLPDELLKGIPFYGPGGFDARPLAAPSLESVSRVGASLHLTLKGFHGDVVVVALDPSLNKSTLVSDGRKDRSIGAKETAGPKP